MKSLNENIYEYGRAVEKGDIKKAYQGIMNTMVKIKAHFKKNLPELNVAGSMYQGCMDITFFSLSSQTLREKSLKVAVVYIHEKTRFEVWLTGRNQEVQIEYREILRKRKLNKYPISPDEKGVTSIVEAVLVDQPDFDKTTELINQIETGVVSFINEIESWKLN